MSSRRIVLVVLAIVLIAASAYSAYWFHVAGEMRKGVETWASQQRAEGWQVTWSDLDVRGFPGDVRARIREPHLISPAGIGWSAEAVSASASPFDLTNVFLEAPGRHILQWHVGPTATVTAAEANGRLNLTSAGDIEDASVFASGISGLDGDGRELKAASLALSLDAIPTIRPGHDTATIFISGTIQDVVLPPVPGLLMEPRIALMEMAGQVMGPLPPGEALPALRQWSEQGGTVEIERLILDWEPITLAAEGTLAFDAQLQPLVALSARVRGYGDLMDRLAKAGTIDRSAAEAAKMLLSLLAKPDPQGRPAIAVPVTVQDGRLFLGPAPVARIPPIRWPEE